jgi:hypothetical protein
MYRVTVVSEHPSAFFFRDKEPKKNLLHPEIKALGSFETTTSIYQSTRRKIIEDFHPFSLPLTLSLRLFPSLFLYFLTVSLCICLILF